ncbi:MAG: phosphotransferase [Chloroflexi bacterium]|nr:phosphotransferase [Chloroflexota bacterium]
MEELLKSWDIGNVNAIEPISSYWGKTSLVKTVDNRCFILKEKPDLMEQEFDFLSSLSKVGAPVAVPIRTVEGAWHTLSEGKVFCLYPKLPGKVITEHYAGNAAARAEAFGRAIGFLHTCLRKCDNLSGFREMKLVEQVQEWAIPCIRKNGTVVDGDMIEGIWREVEQEMVSLCGDLPKQLIHRDPNPSNMLFDKGKLTGFVDFDMVLRGPRIFDVCYCGTSILVGGFQDSAKVQKWPGLFRSLVRGYQELCPLTSSEHLAAYGTLAAIQLLFMAFSLETQAEDAARCNASVLSWLSANRELVSVW